MEPHDHWPVDVSYLNVAGTFYYLCSVLDGCSRFIIHWEIRASMVEQEVEIILQRARELHPETKTRCQAPVKPQKTRRGIQVSPMRSTRMRARAA
ncbi:DDE-type integrase/transposase/recombinase [Candidatus Magnetaquiglobus chichijimensis]|uniref:DDE-type integrase/transposase/recombinase n=1 Tax=Candidatus Magnetaquiglobus chichijimensis TaxID=3141448 RepID=UPI003B97894B